MNMSNRRYEQGGVVSFLVVGTVLTLLLAGCIWYAKKSQVAADGKQVAQASEQKTDEKTNNSTSQGQNNSGTTGNNDSNSGSNSDTSSTPPQNQNNQSTTPPVNTEKESTTPSSGGSITQTGPSTEEPKPVVPDRVASTGPSTEELPKTGVEDVLPTMLGISALSAVIYLLVQSQKRVRASALK
jgi:outer membrane murein-binding lipoprotein Lpp